MRLKLVCAVLGALAAWSTGLHAQTYPSRPVKVITPFPAGSGPDAALRLVADRLTKSWGKPLVIENRPGANGFIALGTAKSAAPDGYILAQASSAQLSTHRLVYKSLPYDPAKDFEPITPLFRNYFFVVVPAASRWMSMTDLVSAAKAKPKGLAYGSEFIGSPGHLGAALLEAATGTQMTHVPFKETTQLFTAVGTGDIHWAFGTAGTAGAAIRSGKARFLALAAPLRLPAFPDVPTVTEAGGPIGFELAAWTGMLAPKGTPGAIVEQLNRDIAKALADAEVRERFSAFGYDAWPLSPAGTAAAIDADVRRYADIVKRLNLQLD